MEYYMIAVTGRRGLTWRILRKQSKPVFPADDWLEAKQVCSVLPELGRLAGQLSQQGHIIQYSPVAVEL
jgi:hypothetical protein